MGLDFKNLLLKKFRIPRGLAKSQTVKAGNTAIESARRKVRDKYQLVNDEPVIDQYFLRLKRRLYTAIDFYTDDQLGNTFTTSIFRESGKLAPGRPYFYFKPPKESGWLFERSGSGWLISKADKIVDRSLFLRKGGALDQVTLYSSGSNLPRVSSYSLSEGLLSFAVYEEKLLKYLGL